MESVQSVAICDGKRIARDAHGTIGIRHAPYPYQAMLAICSDLDDTAGADTYFELMRFLNTTETTTFGDGVGLEVGNSIHFDVPPEQFSYWNADEKSREAIRHLILSGHIDCLHSYGELANTRAHAVRALDELSRHECRLEVWVDHGGSPMNFGADIMAGHGDEPGHPAYHADLTTAFGVQYVWRGRVTSIIGQDVWPQFGGLFRTRHPWTSGVTIGKEAAKCVLGCWKSSKYSMHTANAAVRSARLRDGTPVWEFLRSNPHWAGVSSCDKGGQIGDVLTDSMLTALVERRGVCVLYTHLGKIGRGYPSFGDSSVKAFHRLAEACQRKSILVTTTRRLLGFCRARRELGLRVTAQAASLDLCVSTKGVLSPLPLSRRDLAGLTFYVPAKCRVRVLVDEREATDVQHNAPDDSERPSVSIPWPRLAFPNLE
jgi:hypothetical protein